MDAVVHFEMPYDNRERVTKFYKSAFGWETNAFAEEPDAYLLATTVKADDAGGAKPGAINGGFYPKKIGASAQYPSVVIAVDDISLSMKKVTDAGGKVMGEPMEIPGVGKYVSFLDPEGNRVSMLQPIPRNPGTPQPK